MALAMIGQAKSSHLLLAHRRLSIKAHKALCFLPTLSLSLQTLYSQVDKLSTIKQGLPFWGAMRLRVNNMLFHPIIKVVGLIPMTPLTLQAFPTQVGSQTTHIWALKRLTTMLSGIWSMPLRFQKTLNLVPTPPSTPQILFLQAGRLPIISHISTVTNKRNGETGRYGGSEGVYIRLNLSDSCTSSQL